MITNKFSDGLLGRVHSTICGSSKVIGTSKRWEWLCKGLMHVLCIAEAIPSEADILQE